jgi:glycosyltransferase involved in cell wall biosynthesis
MNAAPPEVCVVVASHDRPVRLLWLLHALAEQDLEGERFEVVVAHDSRDPETEALLREHPLAAAGRLRHIAFAPGSQPPSVKRDAAWRASAAPLVAFTDDDCRPEPGWLRSLMHACERAPGQVVQGATVPDPEEAHLLHAAGHVRSMAVTPPHWHAHTCNIAYPRALLERVGGFDDLGPSAAGEDTDLFLRVRQATGAGIAAAPDAIVRHAVEVLSLRGVLRATARWEQLALVLRRHPRLRRRITLGVFWKPSHAWALLALAAGAAGAARRRPAVAAAGALPWVLHDVAPGRPRAVARALRAAPARALVDVAEIAVLARGSVRHRTLFL